MPACLHAVGDAHGVAPGTTNTPRHNRCVCSGSVSRAPFHHQVLLANVDAIDWALLPRALMGLLALLCGNGYIVGINQIYDVDIDAVNKPFLPVAAGRAKTETTALGVDFSQHGLVMLLPAWVAGGVYEPCQLAGPGFRVWVHPEPN